MAGSVGVITGIVIGASGVTLLARIVGLGTQPITQATLVSASYTITDLTTNELIADAQALTISSVIFDTLQTDARWDADSAHLPGKDGLTGYNFMTELPAAWFVNLYDVDPTTNEVSPHMIQVDVEFVPEDTSWQSFRQPWRFEPVPTWP